MPTNPKNAENKASKETETEKNITITPKQAIEDLLRITQSNELSYDIISQKVDSIIAKGGNERDEELKNYFYEVFRDIHRNGVRFHLNEEASPTKLSEGIDLRLLTGLELNGKFAKAYMGMLNEKNPELAGVNVSFDENPERTYDELALVGREFNALDGLRLNGRLKDISIISDSAKDTLREVKKYSHKYDPGYTSTRNTNIEELYVGYMARKEVHEKNMAEKNWRWKIRNIFDILKTRSYLKTCKEIFKRSEFDFENHPKMIEDKYASKMYAFVDTSVDLEKQERTRLREKLNNREKRKNIKQLTVATEKIEAGIKLNEVPETSLLNKMMPYINKYNITMNGNFSTPISGYVSSSELFDTERDLEKFESNMKSRYLDFYGAVGRGYLRTFGKADIKAIMDIAQEMLDIELKHYTIVLDHPEAKPLADKNVYGVNGTFILKKRMVDMVKGYNRENGKETSQEEIKAIQDEIESIVSNAKEERQRLLEEEAKAKETVENEKETAPTEIEGEKTNDVIETENVKEQFTVELNDNEVNKEVSQPVTDPQVKNIESKLVN